MDGVGLAKLLTGEADDSREESFLMHYPHAPHRSTYFTVFRDGDWKLIYHYIPTEVSDGSHYQLYNLKNDPFESTNVASDHPKELSRLVKALSQNLETHGANYPVDENGIPLKPKAP